MKTGTTKSGFHFQVDPEIMDDWEFVEDLVASSKNGFFGEVGAAKRLLGDEQYKRLKEHVRDKKTGKVSGKRMDEETFEILESLGTNEKNS
jgi:hypothetical protein